MTNTDIHLFQNMPIFGGLSKSSLEIIMEHAEVVDVAMGDFFYKEGDHGNSLFVLTKGKVKGIKVIDCDNFELGMLAAGDCFGMVELINPSPRLNSIVAQLDSSALKISSVDLLEIYNHDVEQYTIIQMNMAREICRRLRSLEVSICEFGSEHHHLRTANL